MIVLNSSSQIGISNLILLSIPILIIVAFPLHFLYDVIKRPIIGIFSPVNESVWEHLKLVFWPIIIIWISSYYLFKSEFNIDFNSWFVAMTVSVITSMLIIVAFYYTYTGALGFQSIILDIFSLVLGVIVGQYLSLHIYQYSNPSPNITGTSLILVLLMAIAFFIFTFYPPHLPIFLDNRLRTYGIGK